jgi:hypothetical protein
MGVAKNLGSHVKILTILYFSLKLLAKELQDGCLH